MSQSLKTDLNLDFLSGGGAMGALIRGFDWASTAMGPPEGWPQSLRSALSICLNSSFPTAIYWGPDLRLLYNDAWAPIPAERHPWALGRPAAEVWFDIWEVVGPQFERVMVAGEGYSTFDQMLPMVRDGRPRETYWNYSITPIRGEDGTVAGIFNQGHETTDRVLSDRSREAEARRQRRLFEQAPGFITILSGAEHRFEFVNHAYRRLFGDRDFVGKTVREAFPELEGQGFFGWLDTVYQTGERFIADRVPAMLANPGEPAEARILNFIYEPVLDDQGTISGIFCEGFDVTGAHEAEDRLREKRQALERLNAIAAASIVETDPERIVQLVTDAGVELANAAFGAFIYNPASGERDYTFSGLAGAPLEAFEHFLRTRQSALLEPGFQGEAIVRCDDCAADPGDGENSMPQIPSAVDGTVRSYLAVPVISRGGAVIGTLLFGHPEAAKFSDRHEELVKGLAAHAALAIDNARLISRVQEANDTLEERVAARTAELAEANEHLRQAQKMEAIGQLTGGIAHDFNNLLGGIMGGLEIIERRLATGRTDGIERFIEGARTSAERAASLTQRLLAFSRRQTLDPKPTDVNRLIAGMEDLIRRTVGPAITVEVVGAGGLWPALVDASQLENALLNLTINARDAMPDGGRITIETANKWLDERGARERALEPGQYLSICVTDTGTGIPEELVDKVFDPFFTTKPIGQGTGLGLSMIHGFVRQSGGQVRVYTEQGEGTTMCIYLPRYRGEMNADTAESEEGVLETGAGETVLVVNDEATIRMLIVDVLEEAGYRSIEADDAMSAMKIIESSARIDLLISDVGLPGGMNGRQLADAARITRPDLKILFVTGYAENAAVGNGLLAPGMEVMTKPFVMSDLAAKIAAMLEH